MDRKGRRSGHAPGNGNARVSAGDHAVLLLGVDHGGVDGQRGAGGDYRPRSVGRDGAQAEEGSAVRGSISLVSENEKATGETHVDRPLSLS